MNDLNIEYLNIDELKPYEKNARKHTEKDLKTIIESINMFGFNDPIGIWKDNIIVEGHGRLMAAKKIGLTKVPCIRLDYLTDEQRRAYALAHNKTAEMSDWDMGFLPDELSNITEFDMSAFGFDALAFDDEVEVVEDDFDEELPEEPKTKLGDIYKLGNHRLMCGDSTKTEDIERLINGEKVDLIFTDPPYGNGTSGKYGRGRLGIRTIKGDEDINTFRTFVEKTKMERIIYFLQWRTLPESFEVMHSKNLKINTVAVWDKKNAGLNGAGGISEQWEAIVFAGNIKYKKFGGNVFTVSREQHRREDSPHPHQKPIKLLAEVFSFIDDAETIFDPFGGSGSTLIAGEQLGYTCYMMEFDPKYCDVIINRWEQLTGRKAELIE